MKKITRLLHFTSSQNLSIAILLFLAIILQIAIYLQKSRPPQSPDEEKQWLSMQSRLDSAIAARPAREFRTYPFNPNFITDEKGYRLGMAVEEIDRLHRFRETGKYVNSAAEFQKVTGISDSLLAILSPQFKFPDWVAKRPEQKKFERPKAPVTDINTASAQELIAVYGIGPALSERILNQREKLGGFVSMNQMEHVWGISAEVAQRLNERFAVIGEPRVKKININNASVKELGQFPYFRYPLSKDIVTFRSMNGPMVLDDLKRVKDFPVEKLDIIAVYLEF